MVGFGIARRGAITVALTAAVALSASAFAGASALPATWPQQGTIAASDPAADANFGNDVVISSDGTTAIVAAYRKASGAGGEVGAVYVFVDSGGTWTQQAELHASDGAAGDEFGSSISTTKDGSTVLIGAPSKTVSGKLNAGVAYVFTRNGTVWTQRAELHGTPAGRGNAFGTAVSINGSGSIVAVAAPLRTVAMQRRAGAVYVFKGRGATWAQAAMLTLADPAANDYFGWAVAAKETQVVASSPFHTNSNGSSGAVYGFEAPAGTYVQKTVLTAFDGKANDNFGWSLDISIATMVVGARNHVGPHGTGAAYVFTHSDRTGIWKYRTELLPPDGSDGGAFGESIAISGTVVAVGDPFHDVGANASQGVAYVFTGAASTWTLDDEITATDAGALTEFGQAVAASSTTVMVGEPDHQVDALSGAGLVDLFAPS
jgi:hypothetical protein